MLCLSLLYVLLRGRSLLYVLLYSSVVPFFASFIYIHRFTVNWWKFGENPTQAERKRKEKGEEREGREKRREGKEKGDKRVKMEHKRRVKEESMGEEKRKDMKREDMKREDMIRREM